jgi:GNAT superfamily N-acetyltransferase
MEFALLGWPPDGPTLRLDHREFAYAGKFVMSNTGKAVARPSDGDGRGQSDADDYDDVFAAVSFNADRTDGDRAWLRYVTVRADRRGEGIGPRLVAFATDRLLDRGYDCVRIAVNNPFAYEALHKAGFGDTGERTGLAELVLEHPRPDDGAAYAAGLDAFRERELTDAEREFLAARDGPPPVEASEY